MNAIPWWVWAAAGIALVVGIAWYRNRNGGSGTGGQSGGGSGAPSNKL